MNRKHPRRSAAPADNRLPAPRRRNPSAERLARLRGRREARSAPPGGDDAAAPDAMLAAWQANAARPPHAREDIGRER